MHTQNFRIQAVLALVLAFALGGAQAEDFSPVVGKWKVITQMGANPSESTMEFNVGADGGLKGLGSGRGGSIDLDEVAFDGKTLSWKLTIQGNIIPVSVEVDGDKFAGAAVTPLGNLPVTGSRINEAEANAALERLAGLVGDWEVFTDYNGDTIETKMRVYRTEDDDIGGMLIMLGSRTTIHEFELEGDQLAWRVGIPLVATRPASATATLSESGDYFEGVVKSAVGDIPIRANRVDTTKLVVAPYDDPTLLLGAWTVATTVNETEEYASTIIFTDSPERLHATIDAAGVTYEAEAVDFHIVNEKMKMAVARIHVSIPELSPEKLTFEMIINGDSFEGEELHSNGSIIISGMKTAE